MFLGYLLSARLCARSCCGSQMDTRWILLQGAPGQLRRQTVSLECERWLVQGMWECLQLMELWEPLPGGSASPETPELDFPSRVGVRDTSGHCHLWMHIWSEQPGVSKCGTHHCYHSMGLCLWQTSLVDHHSFLPQCNLCHPLCVRRFSHSCKAFLSYFQSPHQGASQVSTNQGVNCHHHVAATCYFFPALAPTGPCLWSTNYLE